MRVFDIVVIGAGPGGYVSAIRGAQLGAKVALIEKDRLGGTCLNRGCIPTKALYYSAKALKAVRGSAIFGIDATGVGFSLKKAVERKDKVVDGLVGGVNALLKANGVEVISGDGIIEAAGRVLVRGKDGAEAIGAKSIIIATGSEPLMIPAFNIDGKNILTSTEMLGLTDVPSSLLIIGAGVMGCEFASIFSAFGSRIIMLELLPSVLSTEDRQVSRVVAKAFKEAGIEVLTGVEVSGVTETGLGVKTILKDNREFITEKVLVSIGRSFNSTGIGLESLGVKTEKGRIIVNEKMETNVPGVYAIGDVTGKFLLAHVASAQGIVAATNAVGKAATMDYGVVPAGIFTDPEIASVGLKEKDAAGSGIEVNIGRFPYLASGKAATMGETEGFVQILADKATDRVLGCSIVGAHATDLIGEAALAIKAGLKTRDIVGLIHAHPTLPELLMEASEDVHGLSIHKAGRRRV